MINVIHCNEIQDLMSNGYIVPNMSLFLINLCFTYSIDARAWFAQQNLTFPCASFSQC